MLSKNLKKKLVENNVTNIFTKHYPVDLFKRGFTLSAVLLQDVLYFGLAIKCPKDKNHNRTKAREISIGRAIKKPYKSMYIGECVKVEDVFKTEFNEISDIIKTQFPGYREEEVVIWGQDINAAFEHFLNTRGIFSKKEQKKK